MKKIIPFLFIAICLGVFSCSSSKLKIEPFEKQTKLYKPVFIDFSSTIKFINPHNQEEVKADVLIKTPSGKDLVLPCFYRSNNGEKSLWQARFLPRELGKYSLKVSLTTPGGSIFSEEMELNVTESDLKGHLSVDSTNPFFMKFDNGELFRGVGLNVCWEFEPKWDNEKTLTFEDYYDEMAKYNSNYYRIWICPWNYPVEWTPVASYKKVVEEFNDFSKAFDYSKDLQISKGQTPYTQTDVDQLIVSGKQDQYIIYNLDTVRKTKLMIYYQDQIDINDFEISYSADNVTYQPVKTIFSESWDVVDNWRRIFLFSADTIDTSAKYIKYVFKKSLKKDKLKIAGIHINYGNPTSVLDADGLGKYSEKNASRLDEVFENAYKKGIYIMLCMGYHGQFNPIMDSWGANDEWQRNPYYKKNGGPCETPADFFSNEEAKKHYKNYIRYFVARWGYNPAISMWEFWNEIDLAMRTNNVPQETMTAWHQEMATYLKSIDPYNHPVSTSLCCMEIKGLWDIKELDFSQIHRYSPTDKMVENTMDYIQKYNKAHIVGEYAIGWKGPGNDYPASEYEGEFHNGMWRGVFTPVTVLPLTWWWDYHIEAKHYYHFAPLATVLSAMTKAGGEFRIETPIAPAGTELRMISSDKLLLAWLKNTTKSKPSKYQLLLPAKDGEYKINYLNTWTNEIYKSEDVIVQNGFINLNDVEIVNSFDIAFMITKK